MKKIRILTIAVLALMLLVLAFPAQAAGNDPVSKGIQVAADAAKMVFPTDGSAYRAICPVCETMVNWTPMDQEIFASSQRLENGKHYYLTESIEGDNARILAPETGGQYSCFHLNGKDVTATSTSKPAISGSGGVLNIMGSGQVKGSNSGDNRLGSAVQINTGGNTGCVNLYGGTYSKTESSDTAKNTINVLSVSTNGGIINVYSGAEVKIGAAGSAIYLNKAARVPSIVNIYGGLVDAANGKEVAVDIAGAGDLTVQFNLHAGKIVANAAGAVKVAANSKFVMYGGQLGGGLTVSGKAWLLGGAAQNATVAEGAELYLAGDTVADTLQVSGKLSLCDGWNGSAAVSFAEEYAVGETIPATFAQVVTLKGDLSTIAGGSVSGRLVQSATANTGIRMKADGSLYIAGTQMVKADGTVRESADPLTDWATGDYAYIQLNGDTRLEDLSGADITVDLNGFNLNAGGSGNVKLLDSANDSYEAELCGLLICDEQVTVAAEATAPNGRRYIALTDENGVTAHRLDMYLSAVTLRPSEAGMYYKAQYGCDSALAQQVSAYGVAVSLKDMPGADFMSDTDTRYTVASETFQNGVEVTSGSVFGIMKEDLSAGENTERGEMQIYANPYICIGESTLVGNSDISYSLRTLMEKVEENYYTYAQQDRNSIRSFYKHWTEKGINWALANVGAEDPVCNDNLTFVAENQAWCDVCKKEVTWIPVSQQTHGEAGIGTETKDKHYYLTENVTYTGSGKFIQGPNGGTACLHLNGHDLTAVNCRVIMGYSGTLNVLGNGYVAGYNATANAGAAVHINTSAKNGTVNLYGGTYSEYTETDAVAIAIGNNGGQINLYEGATVTGAAYVGTATLTNGVMGIRGGTVTGTVTFTMPGTANYTNRLTTTGQAKIAEVVMPMNVEVSISGAPLIGLMDMDVGAKLTATDLVNGTSVTVRGNGAFGIAGDRAEDYVKYFDTYFPVDSIVAKDGMLVYETDYTAYLTPYETDVIAQAKADGKIHYYFMASEQLWLRKSHNNEKWGDSCLIVFPDGQTMLVDSGYQDMGPLIWRNLHRMGVTKLDHLVISHPHSDHYGGAFGYTPDGVNIAETGFLENIEVKQVYINGIDLDSEYGHELIMLSCEKYNIPVTVLKPGDTMNFGEVKAEILWPVMEGVTSNMTDLTKDLNDTSILIRFDYGEHSSLFVGDLYKRGEGWLLDTIDVSKLDADFLKLPHHGRNTSSSQAFVEAVTAELAVATGREGVEMVDSYTALGATVLNDGDNGYIHITADQNGTLTYETSR